METPWKPTKDQVQAAYGQPMTDIIGPSLNVLFCGINPSLYSAAVDHMFACPGNRFWKTLHGEGFTDRLYSPFEDRDLLKLGYGITNLAEPATACADQLSAEDLAQGRQQLEAKLHQYQPKILGMLGITAYRQAFNQPKAQHGPQPDPIAGTLIWVLPNPSGLNAHYQLPDLQRLYRELRIAAED